MPQATLKYNEDLRKWFKQKWVNIGKKVDGKHPPCGTSGEKSAYAKCVPAAKAAGMSKKEKESATRRKRAAQNDAGRGGSESGGQGKKPINVSTKSKNETMSIEEKLNLFLENNCPTDPGKWAASKAAAKRKFDVYPSAYANGWASKNYKSKGGGWRKCKNENIVNEEPVKSTGEIKDLTGHDIVRTPMNPDQTFKDNPLQMLRVIRFAVKYDWKLPVSMMDTLKKNANQLTHVSKERIRDEVSKILMTDDPDVGLRMLTVSGLNKYIVMAFLKHKKT